MIEPAKPTREELLAARNGFVPDIIAPGLRVLFCGINPGLLSAALGQHFARPGNRFWPALHRSGFTDRIFAPAEQHLLLDLGLGITNVVDRPTAGADELGKEELKEGGRNLESKVLRYAPDLLAVLGIGAYRTAFGRPKAMLGLQPEKIGSTRLWVLPNPSGLNAHYQIADLAAMFRELREEVEGHRAGGTGHGEGESERVKGRG